MLSQKLFNPLQKKIVIETCLHMFSNFQLNTFKSSLNKSKKEKKNWKKIPKKKYQNTRNHIPTIPYASLPSMSLSFMRWTYYKLTWKKKWRNIFEKFPKRKQKETKCWINVYVFSSHSTCAWVLLFPLYQFPKLLWFYKNTKKYRFGKPKY